jgi:glycolate oxidase iron-sulfur subunit
LSNVGGIEVKPLQGFETCCGGAGIYNLIHPDISRDILAEKVENIRRSGADAVATGNPGCIMQIKAGLTSAGLDTDVLHPVDLLDALYS